MSAPGRVVAIHAGGSPESATGRLARGLLASLAQVSKEPLRTRVIAACESLPPWHGFGGSDDWPEPLRAARAEVAGAVGVIAVSPVIHGSYSGPFKSFIDLLGAAALRDTPVVVAACGGSPRHCLMLEHAMRPLFACLRSVVMPTVVYATVDECRVAGLAPPVRLRAQEAGRELVAAIAGRAGSPLPQPLAVRHG